jgi:hypothetical protein
MPSQNGVALFQMRLLYHSFAETQAAYAPIQ